MPEIEEEPTEILEDEPVLEEEPVVEEPDEPPVPLPDYVTREQYEAQQQELADLRAKFGQPAVPAPTEKQRTPREILAAEVTEFEDRGQYVSEEWKQDRLAEIRSEKDKQELLQALAPILRKTLENELIEDAAGDVQEAAPAIRTALREGKIDPAMLQNPQVAEWARKAAQFDAGSAPKKTFQPAAPVGGVPPTAGLRARLAPVQKQELATWEADLKIKYTDDMIKEAFNLA